MSENKHTPAITGFDAEFLSKRLGRVCARLGIAQPFGDNHESNAEVAGTTLAAVDRAIESLVKQRDDLLAALAPFAELIQQHHAGMADSRPVFQINDKKFTVGDLRRANAVISSVKGGSTTNSEQISTGLVDGEPCKTCNGDGGHEVAASSTNYFWKECSDCDGGSRAGYECPVCRQSDCRGCVKGGAA